jgi:lipoprotein-anchoring transpeptidase ErfK/SrfK
MRQVIVAFLFAVFVSATAWASVEARIDISSQRMEVYENGVLAYSWSVSTARKGYRTPVGSYRPTRLHKMWYSRKYDNSPMPHSIFFLGGYAIHGTNYVRSLGRPASHGCVRLAPGNARILYNLVRAHGSGNTRIVVTR